MGKLTVRLIEGRNLEAKDIGGKSDPYCILRLKGGGCSYQSKVVNKNLNPVWNDLFNFEYLNLDDVLEIQVWDKDRLTPDEPMGNVEIRLSEIVPNKETWFNLKNTPHGSIQLLFTLDTNARCPVNYKIHYNSIAAGLQAAEGDKISKYPTYEIDIFHVRSFFGDEMQHWNTNYDNAIKIFGPGAQAAIVRGVIHTQHAELYREGLFRTDSGVVKGADDFFKLVNYGVRSDIRRFFTYVLLDDKFLFSETGASFFKDFMSKHAMHADGKREVRYAGEFHIQTNPWRLVIDNNSGTYSPKKDLLPKLAELFQANIPGLIVEALDYSDPKLKEYKKAMEAEKAEKEAHKKKK